MIIKSLELSDFRNYENLKIDFSSGTNILYGDNAQGKTNILEAIFMSATTKSHKGSKDKEIIRFGKDEAHIRTILEKDNAGFSTAKRASDYSFVSDLITEGASLGDLWYSKYFG